MQWSCRWQGNLLASLRAKGRDLQRNEWKGARVQWLGSSYGVENYKVKNVANGTDEMSWHCEREDKMEGAYMNVEGNVERKA